MLQKTTDILDPKNNGTLFAAIVLCVLCLALPTYQWATIPQAEELKVLFGAAALALSICKLTFIPLAIDKIRDGNNLAASVLFVAALIALAISITATRDLLNQQTQISGNAKTVNSIAYRNAVTALNGLDSEIKTFNQLLAEEVANNYRDRAFIRRGELQKLKQDRLEAAEKVERLANGQQEVMGASLGKNLIIPLPGKSVSLEATTGVAIALHIMCILAVLACGSWKPGKPKKAAPKPSQNTEKKSAEKSERPAPPPQPIKPEKSESSETKTELEGDQKKLYQKIEAGDFGNEFIMRDIISESNLVGRHARVKPVFEKLEEDNKITKVGRRFALVQTTI